MPLVDLQRLLDWYPLWVEVRERPHAGQEVRHHGEHLPDDWYVRGDPHRTIRRHIADFAERFGRLIECQAGWEPPGAAWAGAEVQGNTSTALNLSPGDDIMSAIANWQDN